MSEPKARAEAFINARSWIDDLTRMEQADFCKDILAFAQAERRLALEEAAKIAEGAIAQYCKDYKEECDRIGCDMYGCGSIKEIAAAIRQQGGG